MLSPGSYSKKAVTLTFPRIGFGQVVCNIGDRSIEDVDKKQLLDHLNKVLHSLDGAMYTGCDLNSTLDDMAYLADKSPYILAAIGNDKVRASALRPPLPSSSKRWTPRDKPRIALAILPEFAVTCSRWCTPCR